MQFSNQIEIFKYADLIGTIVIALLIIKTGYNVLMDNVSILLEEQVIDHDYLDEIKQTVLSFKEITAVNDLHVLRYGPYYKLIGTVIMQNNISLNKAHKIIDRLEITLQKKDERIKYVFIHMEPNERLTKSAKDVKMCSESKKEAK